MWGGGRTAVTAAGGRRLARAEPASEVLPPPLGGQLAPGVRRAKVLRPLALSRVEERQAPLPCYYRDTQVPGGGQPRLCLIAGECGSSGIYAGPSPDPASEARARGGRDPPSTPLPPKRRCGSALVVVCVVCCCVCVGVALRRVARPAPESNRGKGDHPGLAEQVGAQSAARPSQRQRRWPTDRINSVFGVVVL